MWLCCAKSRNTDKSCPENKSQCEYETGCLLCDRQKSDSDDSLTEINIDKSKDRSDKDKPDKSKDKSDKDKDKPDKSKDKPDKDKAKPDKDKDKAKPGDPPKTPTEPDKKYAEDALLLHAALDKAATQSRPVGKILGGELQNRIDLVVTTTKDTATPGSLRYALMWRGARKITFDAKLRGKTIQLTDHIRLWDPAFSFCTLECLPDVKIAGGSIYLKSVTDFMIRNGHFELVSRGAKPRAGYYEDVISVCGCSYILIENCSLRFSADEICSVRTSQYVIIKNNIIAMPLANAKYNNERVANHAYSGLYVDLRDALICHNLYAIYEMRPQIANAQNVLYYNNAHCLYQKSGIRITSGLQKTDIINNLFVNPLRGDAKAIETTAEEFALGEKVFFANNKAFQGAAVSDVKPDLDIKYHATRRNTSIVAPELNRRSITEFLSDCGPSARDATDLELIRRINSAKGGLVTQPF